MNIREEVREFITNNLLFTDENIEFTDDIDIFSCGFVNSLFAVNLLAFIEMKYSITIDNSELDIENFNTINHIVKFVEKKMGE